MSDQPTTPPTEQQLTAAIYDALVDFQRTAQLSSLQHAQMRQHLADHPDWTETEGGVICPVSDQAHDKARGEGSPAVLRPARDAMAVSFQTG